MADTDKKQNLKAKNTQALIANVEDNELTEQQRKIFSLIQEKNELQQMLESITAEKEQLKTDLRENIEMVRCSTVHLTICFCLCMFSVFIIVLRHNLHAVNVSDTSAQSDDF